MRLRTGVLSSRAVHVIVSIRGEQRILTNSVRKETDQATSNCLQVSNGGRRYDWHVEMDRMRQSLGRAFSRKELTINNHKRQRESAYTRDEMVPWSLEQKRGWCNCWWNLFGQPLPDACRDRGPCFGRSASLSHVSSRRHLTHLTSPNSLTRFFWVILGRREPMRVD